MIIIAMPLHVLLVSLLAVVLLSLLVSRNNRNSDENFERLASVLLLFLETNNDDDDSHTPYPYSYSGILPGSDRLIGAFVNYYCSNFFFLSTLILYLVQIV